jgi:hypothetical protein
MFYEAMRCSGVGKAKAKVMYYAVYRFGPRWGAAEAAAVSVLQLDTAAAETVAADAEAIFVHDLSLDEIEALARARNRAVEASAAETEGGVDEAVRRIIVTGGTGDQDDLNTVARSAALLPLVVLDRLAARKVRLVACRSSVTDFEKDLRGVTPRGWELTGRTWDSVPGAYFPNRKRVVIATIGSGGAQIVPGPDSGLHGSHSLTAHETLHGFDHVSGYPSHSEARFRTAREADLDRLDAYERQAGEAGLEETYAESGARFYVDGEALKADWPALHAYWLAGPAGAEAGLVTEPPVASAALGTVERLEDGALQLSLRAEDASGAVGHALLRIGVDDPQHGVLTQHVFGAAGVAQEAEGRRRLFIP